MLWQDADGRRLAFVAESVEGQPGPHLIVIDRAQVSVTSISADDEMDQRRIATLASFAPAGTAPADVDSLLRERKAALAAADRDPVRFMPYPAASSAHLPCTAPPP